MTKYKIIVLVFIAAALLLMGFKKIKKSKINEDKWSGTVTFHEKKTGPTIARYDWWMIAKITNNVGDALDSAITENTEGDKFRCATSAKTELELGIEEDKNEYGITVPVPGCYGQSISKYGDVSNGWLTDETGIVINNQQLGSNRNILKGNLVLIDTFKDGTRAVTTYTWDLKKSK